MTELNGVPVFYLEQGKPDGLPVVLIHAFPLSHEMWAPQVEALKDYRVISYDIRGFGKTGAGDGRYTLELFVNDLIALLDYLHISKAVLCGLSMGGYIALRAKERHPERVAALILADTRADADTDEGKVKRAQTIQTINEKGLSLFADGFVKNIFAPQTHRDNGDLVDQTKKTILSNMPLGVCGALLAMANRTDTSGALTHSPVPTLFLTGEHDALIPPKVAMAMHEICPNSKLKIISKAGHMSSLENAKDFNAALLSFLQDRNETF